MGDWIFDHPGWCFLILITVTSGLIYLGFSADNAHRQSFMTACTQDHKNYECDAMWRAGEPDIIPVFIPTGR